MEAILTGIYALVGLVFVAGAGALMFMFAFMQVTARIAIWLDVVGAFNQRKALAQEVVQLKQALDVALSGQAKASGAGGKVPDVLVTDLTGSGRGN